MPSPVSTPRRWVLRPDDIARARALAMTVGIPDIIALLLLNRGVESPEEATAFLAPGLEHMHDPFLMRDMDIAVDRVLEAIDRDERIVVFGDFDVDGSVSTALLVSFFRHVGANAHFRIPKRLDEGYGLNRAVVTRFHDEGTDLLITVDNGVSAVDEVALAVELGIDVIVTDHHVVGKTLPPALAVLDPKRPDCGYPHEDLAGVGVAFKLMWGVLDRVSQRGTLCKDMDRFLEHAIALTAIGTVADLVPLRGENRVFVKFGLPAIASTPSPGLRALLDQCNLSGQAIQPNHVGYRLGPRVNAGGRMGHEDLGVKLLLSESYQDALSIAGMMESENRQRQEIERAITENARQRVRDEVDLDNAAVIVMASDDWHPGVIGIVSSRLADEFWRPTILIAMDGPTGRGSARSIPRYNLYNIIATCEDILVTFGGHAFAAGLEIKREHVDEFRLRLNAIAGDHLEKDTLKPTLELDCELDHSRLDPGVIRAMEKLAPHGEQNPAPTFSSPWSRVVGRPTFRRGRETESQH